MTLPIPSYRAVRICSSKTCALARIPQPLTNFHKNSYMCKPCVVIRDKTYHLLNADKKREQCRAWYERNREYKKTKSREWRKKFPEKQSDTRRKYYRSNLSKCRFANSQHRVRKYSAAICDFTHKQWIALQEQYDHRCAYCKKRFKGKLTQDHVIPLIKGGNHTLSNIVPACKHCNSSKGAGRFPTDIQSLLFV